MVLAILFTDAFRKSLKSHFPQMTESEFKASLRVTLIVWRISPNQEDAHTLTLELGFKSPSPDPFPGTTQIEHPRKTPETLFLWLGNLLFRSNNYLMEKR